MARALDIIQDQLDWRGWSCVCLDGATPQADRPHLIQQFNDAEGQVFAFLLSTRAGGVGLNLQSADTVIMYDSDWNPQMDLQAQSRAHRLGQNKPVYITSPPPSATPTFIHQSRTALNYCPLWIQIQFIWAAVTVGLQQARPTIDAVMPEHLRLLSLTSSACYLVKTSSKESR